MRKHTSKASVNLSRVPVLKTIQRVLALFLFVLLGLLVYHILSPRPAVPSQNSTQSPSPAVSQQSPAPLIPTTPSPIKITVQIQSTDSGKIKGNITFTNPSQQIFSDLFYDVHLDAPDFKTEAKTSNGQRVTIGTFSNVQLTYIEKTLDPLQAQETRTVSFELPYSPHLYSDTYRLGVNLNSSPRTDLAHDYSTTLDLKGSGDTLKVSSCMDIAGETPMDPLIAPPSTAKSRVTGSCQITNPTTKTIVAKYKTDYAIMHVVGYPTSEKFHQISSDAFTFAPGETKKVTFPLPSVSTPQVYEALITFVDQNNNSQSAPVAFRWTIPGASATIAQLSLDRDYYLKGDHAFLTVQAAPSLDLYWQDPSRKDISQIGTILENPELVVTLFNGDKQPCSQLTRKLEKPYDINSWADLSYVLTITRDCYNPTVEAHIYNDGKELASATEQNVTQSSHLPTRSLSSNDPYTVSLVTSIVLLIFLILVLNKKIKPAATIFLLALTTLPLLFYNPKTVAAVNYINGNGNTVITGTGSCIEPGPYDKWSAYSSENTAATGTFYGSAQTYTDGRTVLTLHVDDTGPGRGYWCANSHGYTYITVNDSSGGSIGINNLSYGQVYGPNSPYYQDFGSFTNSFGSYKGNGSNNSTSYAYQDYTVTYYNNPTTLDAYFTSANITIHGLFNSDGSPCNCASGPALGFVSNNQTSSDSSNGDSRYIDYCNFSSSGGYPEQGHYSWTRPCAVNTGAACNRASCGGTGVVQCNGSCSAPVPVCDTTPPAVTITNPPADTCYTSPTGSNGTPWSSTQPILVGVDDTRGGTVASSGISSVSIQVINLSNNAVTRTISGSLSSGSTTNGTYSITIPQDSTTFPTNGGRYSITAYASDNASHTSNSAAYSFTYDATGNACTPPHIQTQNGDVHSQQNIGQ